MFLSDVFFQEFEFLYHLGFLLSETKTNSDLIKGIFFVVFFPRFVLIKPPYRSKQAGSEQRLLCSSLR